MFECDYLGNCFFGTTSNTPSLPIGPVVPGQDPGTPPNNKVSQFSSPPPVPFVTLLFSCFLTFYSASKTGFFAPPPPPPPLPSLPSLSPPFLLLPLPLPDLLLCLEVLELLP